VKISAGSDRPQIVRELHRPFHGRSTVDHHTLGPWPEELRSPNTICKKIEKALVNVIFCNHVFAFEMISILGKLKPLTKFNMEHPELHPNYVFISYFDT
jgi:hypothetical protein